MWMKILRPWYINYAAVVVGTLQYYWVFYSGLTVLFFVFDLYAHLYYCCTGERLYFFWDDEDERQEHLMENLKRVSRIFDSKRHKAQVECCICMVEYKEQDMVTRLPCDKRHFFHSDCIELWSKT